jgi:hypothetical protein
MIAKQARKFQGPNKLIPKNQPGRNWNHQPLHIASSSSLFVFLSSIIDITQHTVQSISSAPSSISWAAASPASQLMSKPYEKITANNSNHSDDDGV